MHLPTEPASLLWALPISFAIAMVYKAIKLESFTSQLFVREVVLLFITLIGFLTIAALCLLGVSYLSRM